MLYSRIIYLCASTLLLTHCSGSDKVKLGPDASSPDAPSADAAPTTGPVKARAVFKNAIVPNAMVVFTDADGTERSIKMVDANGEATETMAAGGSVRVVMPTLTPPRVFLFEGVKPGDTLPTGALVSPTETRTISIILPAVAGGSYTVRTTCGDAFGLVGGQTQSLSVRTDCTTADIYAVASANGTSLGSLFKSAVAVPANAVLNFRGDTLTADVVRAVQLQNLGTEPTALAFHANLQLPQLEMEAPGATVNRAPIANNEMLRAPVPGITASGAVTRNTVRMTRATGLQIAQIDTAVGDVVFDVGSVRLPWLLSPMAWDGAARALKWVESAGQAPQISIVQMNVVRNDAVAFVLHAAVSPTPGKFVVPKMPATLAAFDIQPTDAPSTFSITMASRTGSNFDTLRPLAFVPQVSLTPSVGNTTVASISPNPLQ